MANGPLLKAAPPFYQIPPEEALRVAQRVKEQARTHLASGRPLAAQRTMPRSLALFSPPLRRAAAGGALSPACVRARLQHCYVCSDLAKEYAKHDKEPAKYLRQARAHQRTALSKAPPCMPARCAPASVGI